MPSAAVSATKRIGIYDDGDVRGFSPIDAGNVRIEGLYFDRQTDPTERLIEGSAIRVGIAAQSYPFPSPTGIVDYDLRRVGDERVISPVLHYGPFGSVGAEVDALLPLVPDRLGVAAGVGFYRDYFEWGGGNRANSLAIIPRWRPTEEIELMPFYSRVRFSEEEPQPLLLTADGMPPPKIRRDHYFGQRWAQTKARRALMACSARRHCRRAGRRGSASSNPCSRPTRSSASCSPISTKRTRRARRVVAFPESRYGSRSGELRLSRSFDGGTRRHTIHITTKGRIQERRYGGEDVIEAGSRTGRRRASDAAAGV